MNSSLKKLRALAGVVLTLIIATTLYSCGSDDPATPTESDEPEVAKQTVFMFLPLSGNLYSEFLNNIKDFEKAIKEQGGLKNNKFVVFIAQESDQNTCYLIKINYKNNACIRDTLKTYSLDNLDYTTAEGLSSLLNDVKTVTPAYSYSMIIGSHGMGWLPVEEATEIRATTKNSSNTIRKTRWFGHKSNYKYRTNISTLAESIKNTGTKLKFLMFDNCYMSNIETAYELKDATDYLIASTCEIMAYGMPYDKIGKYLFENDYENICKQFFDFYSTYETPCGTIAVTDCSQLNNMAQIMKEINTAYPDGLSYIGDVQKLDGYPTTVFYDFGDYVDKLCEDETLKASFNEQLEKLVPYKAHTPTFFSVSLNGGEREIKTYSGLTISDPSLDQDVKRFKSGTAWYKTTH